MHKIDSKSNWINVQYVENESQKFLESKWTSMINVRHRVMPCDFVAAAKEAHCISECINIAAAGMAMDDLNMVQDRLQDGLRSVEALKQLQKRKESFDLAGEFLSKTVVEAYEKQMGGSKK